MSNERVPIDARANIEPTRGVFVDPRNSNLQNESVPPAIGNHYVAAAAQHKQRQSLFA